MMLKDIVYFFEKKYSLRYPVHINHFSFSFGKDGYCELALRQTAEGEQLLLGAYQDNGKVTAVDSSTGIFTEYLIDGRFNLTLLAEDIKRRFKFLELYQRVMEDTLISVKPNWILHVSHSNYIALHYADVNGELGFSEFDPTIMAFRLNISEEHADQLRNLLERFKVGVINEQTRLICSGV